VVSKVEHHAGEMSPRVGFIVTNLRLPSRAVVRFYNKRGTEEQWIKEGKQAVKMTRLNCHRFRSNEVQLWLSLIAYNLGNLWRRLALPQKIENWSLTSSQQRLAKSRPTSKRSARCGKKRGTGAILELALLLGSMYLLQTTVESDPEQND
jgi:cytochrome c-type biogenesis protein CcmH/NrfG